MFLLIGFGLVCSWSCHTHFSYAAHSGWEDAGLCGLTHFFITPLERELTSASIAVHGTWDEWSPWSLCSSTCGRGYRDRTRTCKPPQFGGNPCEGPEKQTKFCNIALCPGKAVRDSKPSLQQVISEDTHTWLIEQVCSCLSWISAQFAPSQRGSSIRKGHTGEAI